jgi:hypothetical protein
MRLQPLRLGTFFHFLLDRLRQFSLNQLQAVALNEGLRCKKRLWREAGREQLDSFKLAPRASRRRRDLLIVEKSPTLLWNHYTR